MGRRAPGEQSITFWPQSTVSNPFASFNWQRTAIISTINIEDQAECPSRKKRGKFKPTKSCFIRKIHAINNTKNFTRKLHRTLNPLA